MSRPATHPSRRERHRAFPVWTRMLAVLLGCAVLAIGLAARSPEAHEHVHHDDAHDANHVCAITLAATGFCDTAAPALEIVPGASRLHLSLPQPGSFAWTTPAYWLIPAQAPPGRVA